MSKGLEALKHIVEIVDFYTKEKKYYDMRFFPQCDEVLWLETIEKELKALEIIKEKELNIFFVKRYNLEDFNYQCRYEQQLTQEECNLLKEVLNES